MIYRKLSPFTVAIMEASVLFEKSLDHFKMPMAPSICMASLSTTTFVLCNKGRWYALTLMVQPAATNSRDSHCNGMISLRNLYIMSIPPRLIFARKIVIHRRQQVRMAMLVNIIKWGQARSMVQSYPNDGRMMHWTTHSVLYLHN